MISYHIRYTSPSYVQMKATDKQIMHLKKHFLITTAFEQHRYLIQDRYELKVTPKTTLNSLSVILN